MRGITIALFALWSMGCVERSIPPTQSRVTTLDVAPVATAPPPRAPALSSADAVAIANEILPKLGEGFVSLSADDVAKGRSLGLTTEKASDLIVAIERDCLAVRDAKDASCKKIPPSDHSDAGLVLSELIVYVGESADPMLPASPAERLLVRLDARGRWDAEIALERILTRKMEASLGPCAPPSDSEIATAKTELHDFLIIDAPASAKSTNHWNARRPSTTELGDLAYFYASVRESGAPVGEASEDESSPPLAPSDPALAKRHALGEELEAALYDGDLEAHGKIADEYLRSLGFPGPIRQNEENDVRWGGSRFSYVIRDAARTAELLGHDDLAATLYRRAEPGGGMCGTSTSSIRGNQIAGFVRATERAVGCRGAMAERLFSSGEKEVGTDRLVHAGFDVERLYRGALLTTNRNEKSDIENAFKNAPSLGTEGTERLTRLGNEAWSTRVRAIAGYADVGRKPAIPALFAIAEKGAREGRVEALNALGDLVEDKGIDPCQKDRFRGWGQSSSDTRDVTSVMHECVGSLDAKEMKKIVTRLGALQTASDPDVRASVARALGKTGAPSAKPILVRMKNDAFDAGGQVCRQKGNAPQSCETNRPVRLAAVEALDAITQAEATRLEESHAKTKASLDH